MKKLLFLALTMMVLSCSSTKHTTAQAGTQQTSGDAAAEGSSYEKAVFIKETGETAGVNAEYKWVRAKYPGSKVKSQALTTNKGKSYDILTIVTADGVTKDVYFDISNFFGKF